MQTIPEPFQRVVLCHFKIFSWAVLAALRALARVDGGIIYRRIIILNTREYAGFGCEWAATGMWTSNFLARGQNNEVTIDLLPSV